MLLTKTNINNGDICSFKLVNGDEIVATVKSYEGDTYLVDRPYAAMVTQQGLALVPLLLTGTETAQVNLDSCHVMMVFATGKEIADHYVQQTTGITLAKA